MNATKQTKPKERYQNIAYAWLILPLAAVAVFCVYPAVAAIFRSFMDWSPSSAEWIWFGNYRELFSDALFRQAFGNMLILVLFSLITSNVMTLLLAELLFNLKLRRLEKVYRYLFLLPALVPGMVTVLLWKNVILSGAEEGLMNTILALFGAEPGGWYFDKDKVILSMILTNFPWVGGVSFLIYLSGLQAIPESVYEAGELEGLGAFKRLVYIDLPLLVSQIKYFIIIGVINGVQVYDIQLILGLSAIDPASTVPGYMLYYYTFASPEYGYAASIGVLLFVITLAVSTVSNKISDRLNAENGV
ncbi:MAG: sugar ABC transporter permease [Clostridia bacterium]|nr:sugar ABC transporter permease [Clostridia bacterium]